MPTAPRYNGPKIESTITPAPNLSGETYGAFNAPKPIDASAVTKLAADIYQEERERADQVAITDATGKLAQAETRILYGENGILTREGEDALKSPDSLGGEWDKAVADITQGLQNKRQKAAFHRQVVERYGSVSRQVQEHVASESRKLDIDRTDAAVTNEQNAAVQGYKDPARVDLAIRNQVAMLTAFADRHGRSKEELEKMVSQAVSSTHIGVIDRMLSNDEDIAANEYFKQHKDQIAGAKVADIEKALEAGSLKGNAYRIADEILKKYSGNQFGADEAVRRITDAKLREQVQHNVDYEFAKVRERRRNMADDAFAQATRIINQHPGANPRSVIPTPLWMSLELDQQAALKRYSDDAAGGSGPSGASADKAYLDFKELTPQDLRKMTRSELETQYLQHLGKRDRHTAITAWAKAKEGGVDPSKNKELSSAFTIKQQIDDALETSRLVTGEKDAKKAEDRLRARVNRRVEDLRYQYADAKGKPLTSQEERAIVDQVILEEAFASTGEKKTIDVKERGVTIAQVVKEGDGTIRVPYGRVPSNERLRIEQEIQRFGGRVTRDKVERAYAAGVMGDVVRAKAIVQEK